MTLWIVTESGLRLALPAGRAFRFAELATYRRLSGRSLKEMDFGWCEGGHARRLVLLELSRYPTPWKPRDGWLADLIQEAVDKATDALLMLSGSWLSLGSGSELRRELPECARGARAVRLVFAFDFPPERRHHLGALRAAIRGRLAGRCAVTGATVTVLTYDTLRKRFPWIEPV